MTKRTWRQTPSHVTHGAGCGGKSAHQGVYSYTDDDDDNGGQFQH